MTEPELWLAHELLIVATCGWLLALCADAWLRDMEVGRGR